jgi:hypothetical protein
MTTVIFSFAVFAAVVGLMAFLVSLGGRPLKGSCGGVGSSACACRNDGLPERSCEDDRGNPLPVAGRGGARSARRTDEAAVTD